MLDDQQDEMLQGMAADFRQPPPTPREEIWARIQSERARAQQSPQVLPFRARYKAPTRALAPRVLIWASGIAAVLLAGIGLGRLLPRGSDATGPTVAVDTEGPSPDRVASVMGMAVRQYLSQTETLLVGVRAGDPGSQFAGLARDLLGMTRLLLDSESLTDPATRRLLEDLELVLAQLVVLPATGDSEQERRLITAGMADRNLMDRLRTALPSPLGSAPAVYGEL